MSTCPNCFGTYTNIPCSSVGCLSTNYAKCITYSGLPLACGTGAVFTISKAGLALSPSVLTEYTVSPTGGSGSAVSVKVTRTPGSNVYTVVLLSGGSGYTVGNFLTVLGTSLGGATPANDLTLQVVTLAPIIANGTNLDTVISNLHQRICLSTAGGTDYSTFNYACLRLGGGLTSSGTAIISVGGFVESASAALCALHTRTLALETPTFTVPTCIALTSGVSTLSQILTAYGTKICSINTQLDLTGVTIGCFTGAPSPTADLQVWFDWVVTNVCSIKTTTDTNVTAVTTNANNLKTYISGGSAVPASINTSCITGGSATSTLSAAAILFTSQICSINTTLATIPATNYTLTWASNFGSTPYYGYTFNYTSASDTLSNQLVKIVDVLGRLKMKLNASDFVATSDASGLNVALASGVRFTCAQLNSCSISSLVDVTSTSPAAYHSLFWNGSEYVNKELIFTSTAGTVLITRANNASDITVNLEIAGSAVTTAVTTPRTVSNMSVIPSTRYSIGSLPKLHRANGKVTISGTFAIQITGTTSWTHHQLIDFLDIPAGYVNTNPEYFHVAIYTFTAASPSIPTAVAQGLAALSGGTMLFYLINPAGTLNFVAGDSLEVILGGNTYKI